MSRRALPMLAWPAVALAVFVLAAGPVRAATSVIPETGNVHEADAAIVPANLGAAGPDVYEPDDGVARAVPLRVGAAPQDHVVVAGDQDWYRLQVADGAGYVRIGSTGPVRIGYVLQPDDQPDWVAGFGGPPQGVDLVEAWVLPDTEYGTDLGVDAVYMVVESQSTRPVDYRISFVSQLPQDRTGSLSAELAAEDFLRGLLRGDLDALYSNSGTEYTEQQASDLRQTLIGQRETVDGSLDVHGSPSRAADEGEDAPVQHLILAHADSVDDIHAWAFVVTCEERDRLWVVTDVREDPAVSDARAAQYALHDYEAMFGQPTGVATTAPGSTPSSAAAPSAVAPGDGSGAVVVIAAAAAVAALAGAAAFWLLRLRRTRRARRAAGPVLVATFGPTTAWAGRTISHQRGAFVLDGFGAVSAADVMQYDREGHLVWSSEGTRAWVASKAPGPAPPDQTGAGPAVPPGSAPTPT
ncbi:MAG TPA: hypothetical protein VMH50_07165 [Thermoleophilia bacterium]|nr:hypothetical protein [Thermoleophilia bacterium]